ncbi:STAS/SEC14 domain-containing protein [Loktanella sp. SALINAS62]|uniref:STAS/SEC14 domain-containing protein n=1 Tax=Loktanella sp. SALINAS62 TaxID=2706124 RepID=UPI001B8CBDA2|nr:STAS/SEC14 domain-containing protein [Loktanella sp. SALINAS62]MBS1301631.1 STAS/SEC14 domain-containing protein [Loktanella sp. SALINAS62]
MTAIHGLVPLPTDHPFVYAFEVTTALDDAGMAQMADMMNTAFSEHDDKVNILIRFTDFKASDVPNTGLSGIGAQVRSLTNVHRYATVGAPDTAEKMISFFSKLIPVDAKTFAAADEEAAWDFVNVPENVTKS